MRILLPISLALGLCFSLMLLFPRGAPTTLYAQNADPAPITTTAPFSTTATTSGAADRHFYLPLIQDGTDQIKTKSGIHLGNRFASDWRIELFDHITGTTGTWPAAVVVRSDQIFTLQRETTGLCRITEAILKLTGAGEPYNAFKYLDAAIAAGTKVIIRIAPSPGNFVDYEAPGDNHRLRADETPAGGNYCDETTTGGRSQQAKLDAFRDIRDLAEEMSEIYTLTVDSHDWPAERLYFEPANEPNMEWYIDHGAVNPNADNRRAWIAMDNYFAALYDLAKALEPALQILSPSMSQKLYGEQYFLGTCDPTPLVGGENQGGMDFMTKTFGVDLHGNPLTPKADGFAIHNYWREGGEVWLPPPPDQHTVVPVVHFHCQVHRNDPNYKPPTYHLLQYLSKYLLDGMTRRSTFITEADLLSNCQDAENPLQYKDRSPEAPDFSYRTKQSLFTFTNQAKGQSETESIAYGADYVIVWLLINQAPNEANACRDAENNLYANHEINWHEAYWEDANHVYEREWFPLWWAAAP